MYQNKRTHGYKSYGLARRKARRWPFALVAVLGIFAILAAIFIVSKHAQKAIDRAAPSNLPPIVTFDKKRYSTSDPTSIWVVANKQRPLNPKDYAPADLRAPNVPLRRGSADPEMQIRDAAATALEKLVADAQSAGINLMLASGYRSYNEQVSVYNSEVNAFGQTKADQESARPGHSEHQTGLAMDLEPTSRKCEIADCFADTPEGKWLAANAYKYGFIIRYTPDKVGVTGYKYEPWHIRFVGAQLSVELHKEGIKTLEEFFGLPAAPNY